MEDVPGRWKAHYSFGPGDCNRGAHDISEILLGTLVILFDLGVLVINARICDKHSFAFFFGKQVWISMDIRPLHTLI